MTSQTDIAPAPIARIVIVAYRSMAVLPRCLEALAAQTRRDFEVVIVNNDPNDLYLWDFDLPDERFSVLEAGDNLGFAGGSNLGARYAKTDWIVTLNPDAFPEPDWFDSLMKAGETYPQAAFLSSVLQLESDPDVWDGLGDVCSVFGVVWRGGQGARRSTLGIEEDCGVVSPCAAAAAYRREAFEAFEAVGGFDETFFCYVEDIDLGLRLQLRGQPCVLVHEARVLHMAGQSTAPGEAAPAISREHLNQKNMVRMMIKTFPSWLLPIGLTLHLMLQVWFLLRPRSHAVGRMRLRGTLAGLRGLRSHWRARRAVQAQRSISSWHFARLLSWSPRAISTKPPKFLDR